MSTNIETALRLTRVINADRDTVFKAFTEPEQLTQWFAPEGMTVGVAKVDLRVGGAFHIRMDSAEGKHHNAKGVYKEIDSPAKLSFTWRWQESDHDTGETLITVELKDKGGSTEVVFIHELFPDAKAAEDHTKGWTSALNRLEGLFAAS